MERSVRPIPTDGTLMKSRPNTSRTSSPRLWPFLISYSFPGRQAGNDLLRSKVLDSNLSSSEPYNGERQVIKTLTGDPIKLYTDIPANFDALKARAGSRAFWFARGCAKDRLDRQDAPEHPPCPGCPPRASICSVQEAYKRGLWEGLGQRLHHRKPKPKSTRSLSWKKARRSLRN